MPENWGDCWCRGWQEELGEAGEWFDLQHFEGVLHLHQQPSKSWRDILLVG